jgi:CheY-like chemotaxis protein
VRVCFAWSRSCWPVEIGKPDLHERPHRILEPRLTRNRERRLVALPHLGGIDALFQPVVARDEQLLDAGPRVLALHKPTLTGQISDVAAAARSPITVLIADDHHLFAEALEAILTTDKRISVVGHARNGDEAVERTGELQPDVILMDISMPVMDGIEAARAIRDEQPSVRVLMLTGSNSRADVDRARRAGAAGYVTKDRIAAELIDAIVEIASR